MKREKGRETELYQEPDESQKGDEALFSFENPPN